MSAIFDFDIPLNISASDKDLAISMGAAAAYQGDSFLYFYAPANKDITSLKKWIDKEMLDLLFPAEKKPSEPAGPVGVTLEKLLFDVKNVIKNAFPQTVWIRAEIVNISPFKPHSYLELSDYDGSGRDKAKARAMIWSRDAGVARQFERKTGISLKAGVKILCQVRVEFSEKYGLSLHIVNIDERFTLGDMEARLIGIRESLRKEGIYDLNSSKQYPPEYTSVAVISPYDAAGLGDFMSHADILSSFKLCKFDVFHAKFQGDKGTSIVDAFDLVNKKIKSGVEYDAIVLIRGGGDKSGIYELNELCIASKICISPIPVITGIGHERDSTILDEVCCVSCATPSMVINLISSKITNNAMTARADMEKINSLSMEKLSRARVLCENLEGKLKSESSKSIILSRKLIELQCQQVISSAKSRVAEAKEQVNSLIMRAITSDPSRVVSKGYAYILTDDGKVVGDGNNINPGDSFSIQMRDGRFKAVKV